MDPRIERINTAASYIRSRIGDLQPLAGIILGSGLGKLADTIINPVIIPYKEIPGFPISTNAAHKGNLIIGELGGKTVIAMQGRFHYYEGYSPELITLPVRVMKVLGIKYLMVSNAAGGVNFNLHMGDLMIINDHISTIPNPLLGPNLKEFGPRFPDMTRPYDKELIAMAKELAASLGIAVKEGVYYSGTGPTYETPAEYKYIRTIGADATGMSTTPEVIVARHSDLRVFGVSVITNEAHDDYAEDYVNDDDDVVRVANIAADNMTRLFTALIEKLN